MQMLIESFITTWGEMIFLFSSFRSINLNYDCSRDIGPAMFEAEAAGLEAMHATNTIRVPKPFKVKPP
jgi:hypothetical protein